MNGRRGEGRRSGSSYVVMSAADKFKHPTKRIHDLWQTDFTYSKVVAWGWYYLPDELEREIDRFVLYYNHERVHESLNNMTPAECVRGAGPGHRDRPEPSEEANGAPALAP